MITCAIVGATGLVGSTFLKVLEEKKLNIDVYFADPYSFWQRGTNENTNGLLREFYPKKFNFSMITRDELDIVVKIINNRPRKCLGYKTPAEVFAAT